MFPLIAIGSAIGAIASVLKGASWLHDHLGAANSADMPGGGGASSTNGTSPGASFQAALAAQAAGQPMPAAAPANAHAVPGAIALAPPTHDTDYQTLARMQAGFAAYQAADLRHERHQTDATQ